MPVSLTNIYIYICVMVTRKIAIVFHSITRIVIFKKINNNDDDDEIVGTKMYQAGEPLSMVDVVLQYSQNTSKVDLHK